MMKPGVPVFVVDSVERAVKFYTEKMAFDVVELAIDSDNKHVLAYAQIRKGKSFLAFRTPQVEELAEFSLIKRCSIRGSGVYIPMKRGIDDYFERCRKKKVNITQEIILQQWGDKTFSIRDPFGHLVVFAQPIEGYQPAAKQFFCGMEVVEPSQTTLESMIIWLKGFGILRRAAKKYSKLWLTRVFGKDSF